MSNGQGYLLFGLLIIFVLMTYYSFRRQKNMVSAINDLQNSIEVGDLVLTSVGLIAKVIELHDNYVELELAEKLVVKWSKMALKEKISD